jgi:predicted nuclease of predicted toxin-antitoxin system
VRWLADECVDAPLVARLREADHNVLYMAEIAPAATDAAVITQASGERRLLLTEDKDFGELVVRWRWSVPGLVLLRMESIRHPHKWSRLDAAIARYGDRLFGRYTVVEDSRIRSRPIGA